MPITVIKLNGEREPYNEKKLIRSLKNSGASSETIKHITKIINSKLYDGITTKEIFDRAFKEFRRYEPLLAPKFDLKHSILRLGKSGFPFENYITHLLRAEGYTCYQNQIVPGKIIPHEIDIIAEKKGLTLLVECKHFVRPWDQCSIQTGLYIYARFLDIHHKVDKAMIVTNTKFSPQVIKYAKGTGMKLLSWDYPQKESLRILVEKHKLYPITMLHSANDKFLTHCLKKDLVLVSQILNFTPDQLSKSCGIRLGRARVILEEARAEIGKS
ncbi:MAG: restriction endonuclease [Nanoarchaeota archaeon]|nr:restriction endonuclease [Nanoarchaeota archaeon]